MPAHRAALRSAVTALVFDPGGVLATMFGRMNRLAAGERFEEAAEVRDRGAALEHAILRQARAESLARAGTVVLATGGCVVVVSGGRLVAAADDHGSPARPVPPGRDVPEYLDPETAREASIIAAWLERNASDVRIVSVESPWCMPARMKPRRLFNVRGPTA